MEDEAETTTFATAFTEAPRSLLPLRLTFSFLHVSRFTFLMRYMHSPLLAPLVSLLFVLSAAAAPRPDIVAIYFPGYHHDDHYDSWFGEGWNEWQLLAAAPIRFPSQRIWQPSWGQFDEANPDWMAKQIGLAADYGIDVFLFDWYWYSGVRILHRPLEEGFLSATNNSRLKFALMWANHDWKNYFPAPQNADPPILLPSRTSEHDFTRLIDYCYRSYFSRTNYWRVNGDLYFGIFESDKFVQQLGGPAETKRILGQARRQMRDAGLGGIHFAAFHWSPDALPRLRDAGFDSVTTYNITSSGKASLPEHPLDPYPKLVDAHVVAWKRMDSGILPYFPVVTIGWDCTPRWEKTTPFPPERNAYPYGTVVAGNTPDEFGRLCRLARKQVEEARLHPQAILVNAWNEWTEGSALLPEKEHGTNFLNTLQKAMSEQ